MNILKNSLKLNYFNAIMLISCIDFYVFLGNFSVKLIYIFLIPFLVLSFLKNIKKIQIISTNIDKYILMWYLSYFLSVGHIISNSDFIIVSIGQLVLISLFQGIINLTNKVEIFQMEKHLIIGMIIINIIGIIQVILYFLFGMEWGISHVSSAIGFPRPSSLTHEPDWYGLVCAISSLYFFIKKANKDIIINKAFDLLFLIISLFGMILSMTRAAWVGFVVGFICNLLFFSNNKAKLTFIKMSFIIIIILTFIFAITNFINPSFTSKISSRLNITQWSSNDGGAAHTRLYSLQLMFKYISMHPFTGNGVGSMNAISGDKKLLSELGYNYEINAGRGNANLFITNLFDVGIIGTLFFIFFIVKYISNMYRMIKLGNNKYVVYLIIFITLITDFQFNNGIRLTYVWIWLAISMKNYELDNKKILIELY